MNSRKIALFSLIILAFAIIAPTLAATGIPKVTLSMADTTNPEDISVALQIVFLITILGLAPSILIMTTSFVRIIIVFSFIRRALGIQTMPPDQVLVGLALFLTFFIMAPTFTDINDNALQPYLAKEITWQAGLDNAEVSIKKFMLKQVKEKDVALLLRVSHKPAPKTAMDIDLTVLIPAFMMSELKAGFIFGFVIYIPFLVLDMIVASVLLSMGMMMLPPIMISLPFKIILFVLIDGWNLIVKQIVQSFY